MTTVEDICNRAVAEIAELPSITPVTGISPPAGDSLAAANACSILYQPTFLALLRQYEWDFARRTQGLISAPTPGEELAGWQYEYLYPSDCIQLRQVVPPWGSIPTNDPQPVRHAVSFNGLTAKVVLTNVANAVAVYTAEVDDPTLWDADFTEAMVRALASALALTLAGRPDFAREKLGEAGQFEGLAESRRS